MGKTLLLTPIYICITYHDSQFTRIRINPALYETTTRWSVEARPPFPAHISRGPNFLSPGTLSQHHDTRNDNSKASIAIRCIFCRRESAPQTASTLSPPPMNGAAPRRARRKENGPILFKHLQSIPKNKAINANRKHVTMTDSYCKITSRRVTYYQWFYGVYQTPVGIYDHEWCTYRGRQ